MTDRKIQIIESKRIRNTKTESKLFLHYSSTHNFTNETPEIRNTILSILEREKNIDILSYSKSLAKSIISDKEIGKKLKDRFGEINDCTSENISNERPANEPPSNRFDNNKCNIGTNFKSGVSIQKENHAFVIILPPRSTRSHFKNKYGIFSSGITSIVQAIARKRKKGEIHVILPRPDEFEYDSLKHHFSKDQLLHFKLSYERIKHYQEEGKDSEKVKYIPLKLQSLFLKNFYDEVLRNDVQKGIEQSALEDRGDLARLDFPPYKNFVLNRGDGYLADKFKFWGGDLSSYLTYCAFTNQFVNCYLREVNYKTYLFFKNGEIQKDLRKYFNIYFGEQYQDGLFSYSNFNKAYSDFRNQIFNDFILKIQRVNKKGEQEWITINPYKSSIFEKQLLIFTAKIFYGVNYHKISEADNGDSEYTRSDYFLEGISCARELGFENIQYDELHREKIEAFQNLNYFREKLERKIETHSSGFKYLPIKPPTNFFSESEEQKFTQLTRYFRDKDPFLANGVFEFIRNFNKMDAEKRKNSFYTILIEDFFNLEYRDTLPKLVIEGVRQQVKVIQSTKDLPSRDVAINIIDPPTVMEIVSHDEMKAFAEEHYGNLELMYKTFQDLLGK